MKVQTEVIPRKSGSVMSKSINLFILGVEKSGTTALFRHLAQSPCVYAHTQREMFYFLSNDEYKKDWDYACEKYFPEYESGLIIAKNVMQINSSESMVRLKSQCPDVKCIVMLREPASRAYSAYNYALLRGAEDRPTFEEALEVEDERFIKAPNPNNPLLYLRNSTYASKIEMLFDIYGKDNVLVIYHEEYKEAPHIQLARVEQFIGQSLFEGVNLDFSTHNKAAKARSKLLARWIYRLLQSHGSIKRFIRTMLPHDKAVKLRHAVLNFNRVVTPYQAMNKETSDGIQKKLKSDKEHLISLIGYCPW